MRGIVDGISEIDAAFATLASIEAAKTTKATIAQVGADRPGIIGPALDRRWGSFMVHHHYPSER
jgi:hypothetical protein